MLLVTTTLPGDRGVSRCSFCHLPLEVSEERLPRLISGEDARLCDSCITDALEASVAGPRRVPERRPQCATSPGPRVPQPFTPGSDRIDRAELRRFEAANPYWHLGAASPSPECPTSDQEAAHVHHRST